MDWQVTYLRSKTQVTARLSSRGSRLPAVARNPEWTKEPIAPGKTGDVKVTYNPKGRPGPFYKTISIYSNGKKGSFTLGIKGNVTPKEAQPILIYPYSIGDLKLQTKNVLYSTVRPEETLGEKISIINEGKTSLNIHLGKRPIT